MTRTLQRAARLRLPAVAPNSLRLAVFALATTALSATAAYASPCTAFTSVFPNGEALKLSQALGYTGQNNGTPEVLAVTGTDVAAGALNAQPPTPAVCEVAMVIASNGNPADSQIQVAVLLPVGTEGDNDTNAWNGRFLGTGNGGFAGSIAGSTLVLGLLESYIVSGKTYVVANTDMGDGAGLGGPPNWSTPWYNCNTLFCGSIEGNQAYGQTLGGLYGNPTAIGDFGYNSTHLMTLAGKQLTSDFYGSAATYSYFHGCSTGGQQALMEAQRFPTDYNGILAGSPAYNRTHLHIASAAFFEVSHAPQDGSGILTNEALALAHSAVLAQCAGTDGGYKGDNFLSLPAQCGWSPSALQCTGSPNDVPCTDPNGTSCTCLVPNQVVSLSAAYSGAHDNLGKNLYPGYERGVEDPNAALLVEEESVSEPLFDSLDYWSFGPTFTWQSLFKSTTTPQGLLKSRILAMDATDEGNGNTFADLLNANNANLSNSGFVKNGGKLIMYAGYEDPLIPSASTFDYYNKVKADQIADGGPAITSFLRLYMAPGVWHCSGGPGANAFGNLGPQLPPVPANPSDDVLGALVNWVEGGVAPGNIIATKYVNDDETQGIAFQRPLCPYPTTAALAHPLKGWQNASNWICLPHNEVRSQPFDPKYGPK
jgi:feruloyl esterase